MYLGDISYSIYIVHFFIAFALYNGIKVFGPKIGLMVTSMDPDLVLINGSMALMDLLTVIYLAVIVTTASFTYRLVEKPGIKLFGTWAGRA